MAEFLIWVVERQSSGDFVVDLAAVRERGSVITIRDDGAYWSKAEQENPSWRIVRIPNVPPVVFAALMEPDLNFANDEFRKHNRMLRRRQWLVDIERLDSLLADDLKHNEVRTNPKRALYHVMTMVVETRPAPPDPEQMGKPPLHIDEFG